MQIITFIGWLDDLWTRWLFAWLRAKFPSYHICRGVLMWQAKTANFVPAHFPAQRLSVNFVLARLRERRNFRSLANEKTSTTNQRHVNWLAIYKYLHSSNRVHLALLTVTRGVSLCDIFPRYNFYLASNPVGVAKPIATSLSCKMESYLTSFASVSF